MTVNGRRRLWADRIAAQRASGQNITDWCTAQHINRRQFHYWVQHLEKCTSKERGKTSNSKWATVNLAPPVKANEPSLDVRVGSVTIEIKPGFCPSLLAEVVRALQSVC